LVKNKKAMEVLKGTATSSGIASGEVYIWTGGETPEIPRYKFRRIEDGEREWARFLAAVESEVKRKERQVEQILKTNKTETDLLKSQIMMLEDIELHDQIHEHIFEKNENAEWAAWDVSRALAQTLFKSQNAYLRERAIDIAGIGNELIYRLLGTERPVLEKLAKDVIIVAHDISPSDAIGMDKKHVRALALDAGSAVCHTAILARSFEIPAVMGLGNITQKVKNGDFLIVNAISGEVFINPDEETVKHYQKTARTRNKSMFSKLETMRDVEAITKDGVRITIKANIELSGEAEKAYQYGAQGIGLYRSEFLFLAPGRPPEEETQYLAYSAVVKVSKGAPVTIRTIDIGGDKIAPTLYEAEEKNPLLGWRAIRFSLANPELFKTQLRAILRASALGPVRIMFPMISGKEELELALKFLEEAKLECKSKKQKFDKNIMAGTMIEVPSAAIIADSLAPMVSFFSIGTNDLLQYSIAVDRGNEKVSYLASPMHPAVLRLIKITLDAAHNAGITAAVCGQITEDCSMTALLTGLGADELSMTAIAIPKIKSVIRSLSAKECRELAENALNCGSASEVKALLKN
jgi:phosphotransferase system enzyme I (PtsI)